MAQLVKYEIPMRSIYWRIAATIVLCFAIRQIENTDFWILFIYLFGNGSFVAFVGWLLWRSLPCKKTLVHRKGDNDD
jgi:hypothetical protein